MKERFAKLLLGEDMSGGAKGVYTALAISNAITNFSGKFYYQIRHSLRSERVAFLSSTFIELNRSLRFLLTGLRFSRESMYGRFISCLSWQLHFLVNYGNWNHCLRNDE